MLIQGLWVNDSPFLQLACFQDEDRFMRFLKRNKKTSSLLEVLQVPPEQRKLNVPDEEKEELNRELALFPNLKVETTVGVNEENDIVEGDVVSIKVKFTRENLAEGQEAKGVHSLRYPYLKDEKWIIILADEDRNLIIYLKMVLFNDS